MRTDYRPDIDGLRAIAVLSVIGYHYGIPWLPGGFVGVDIFFVISGYLITKMLLDDIGAGGLSLLAFYNRRIRRIVPALLVVLVASLAAGAILLMPGDYVLMEKSAFFSTFGAGNIFFLRHTDYFDQQAGLQPLLHLWSLGVEEQFYVVWPLLLALFVWMARGRRAVMFCLTALVVALTFSASVRLVASDPKSAFYLPHTRAWELAAGGLLTFLPPARNRLVAEVAGVAAAILIGWSAFTLSVAAPFPGANAVPPVLASMLLLWPRSESLMARFLALQPLRFLGLISYSLYLWHWPAFVFFRHYIDSDQPTWIEAAALAVVTVTVSAVSWRCVELPARRSKLKPLPMIAVGGVASVVVAAVAFGIVKADGFPGRVPQGALAIQSFEVMWKWDCRETIRINGDDQAFCEFGAPWATANQRGLLWGDSHADHLAPLLDVLARDRNVAFILQEPCPAALGGSVQRRWPETPGYRDLCIQRRMSTVKLLSDHPEIDIVVLASAWTTLATTDLYTDTSDAGDGIELVAHGLTELIPQIIRPDRKVTVVTDMTGPGRILTPCVLAAISELPRRPCAAAETVISSYERKWMLGPIERAFAPFTKLRVNVVRPTSGMCNESTCATFINGEFIFADYSHIRRNLQPDTEKQLALMIGLANVF